MLYALTHEIAGGMLFARPNVATAVISRHGVKVNIMAKRRFTLVSSFRGRVSQKRKGDGTVDRCHKRPRVVVYGGR